MLTTSRGLLNVGSTELISKKPKTGRWHRKKNIYILESTEYQAPCSKVDCICGKAAGQLLLQFCPDFLMIRLKSTLQLAESGPHDQPRSLLCDWLIVNAELHQSEVNGGVELAGDQHSSTSRYPADGLLSEHCAWHSVYAPVEPLLGSGSDTALPCCETLTTLILN